MNKISDFPDVCGVASAMTIIAGTALLLTGFSITSVISGERHNSVAEARRALMENKNATMSHDEAWLVFGLPNEIWTFTPSNHKAHPAYVHRKWYLDENEEVVLEMFVGCEASKAACDQLASDFQAHNRKLIEQIEE